MGVRANSHRAAFTEHPAWVQRPQFLPGCRLLSCALSFATRQAKSLCRKRAYCSATRFVFSPCLPRKNSGGKETLAGKMERRGVVAAWEKGLCFPGGSQNAPSWARCGLCGRESWPAAILRSAPEVWLEEIMDSNCESLSKANCQRNQG